MVQDGASRVCTWTVGVALLSGLFHIPPPCECWCVCVCVCVCVSFGHSAGHPSHASDRAFPAAPVLLAGLSLHFFNLSWATASCPFLFSLFVGFLCYIFLSFSGLQASSRRCRGTPRTAATPPGLVHLALSTMRRFCPVFSSVFLCPVWATSRIFRCLSRVASKASSRRSDKAQSKGRGANAQRDRGEQQRLA